jgi:hypothetical protein
MKRPTTSLRKGKKLPTAVASPVELLTAVHQSLTIKFGETEPNGATTKRRGVKFEARCGRNQNLRLNICVTQVQNIFMYEDTFDLKKKKSYQFQGCLYRISNSVIGDNGTFDFSPLVPEPPMKMKRLNFKFYSIPRAQNRRLQLVVRK